MRVRRAAPAVAGLAMAATLALSACAADPSTRGAEQSTKPDADSSQSGLASQQSTFLSVVDGDTIETSAGTVRILGIDTPERGECGSDQATGAISSELHPGDTLILELPAGENDTDQHGRLIRYVTTTTGVDVGLMQLEAGNAVARYDSSDGYPAHPRERDYHSAQQATLSPDGSVLTLACAPTAATQPLSATERWWEQYPSCSKLRKNTVGHPTGPFARDDPEHAEPYDWFAHRTGNDGDGDGDGLACER
jgi:micrococcal nuclease